MADSDRVRGIFANPLPIVARSNVFDALDYPLALLAVLAVALAYVLLCARGLRRRAEAARTAVVRRFEKRALLLAAEQGSRATPATLRESDAVATPEGGTEALAAAMNRVPDDGRAAVAGQLKTLADRVRTERRGAFAPPMEQPAVKALLNPFGGWGGMEVLTQVLQRF